MIFKKKSYLPICDGRNCFHVHHPQIEGWLLLKEDKSLYPNQVLSAHFYYNGINLYVMRIAIVFCMAKYQPPVDLRA